MPDTVPAKEQSFKAIWKEYFTAEVRIAFWVENPNDEGYSYIESQILEVKPGTVLTYGISGNICGLDEHIHGNGCVYNCGLTEHTHNAACYSLTCNKEHSHSADCYICVQTGHTHEKSCYPNVGSKGSPYNPPSNPTNGQILSEWLLITNKYIYINGVWYKYSGNASGGSVVSATCGKSESTHEHGNDCLGCGKDEHTHTDYTGSCYTLTCQKTAHKHDNTCTTCIPHQHSEFCTIDPFESYSKAKWTLVKSDTVTVEADGSTVMNVYFDRTYFTLTFRKNGSKNGQIFGTIYNKWGSIIIDQFNNIGTIAGTNSWCTDENATGSRTNYIRVMPAANITYYSYYETAQNEEPRKPAVNGWIVTEGVFSDIGSCGEPGWMLFTSNQCRGLTLRTYNRSI
jgi:hypothetical protein